MITKNTKPLTIKSKQLNVSRTNSRSLMDKRTHFVPIHHHYRANSSPYTLSTCCSSTQYSSSVSGCSSCQCSSKSSSNESSRRSRIKIKRIRRRQQISYLLIFIVMLICLIILIFIIKNTNQIDDIFNYFKYAFYSPRPLINEATRKPPQSFTGKPIIWTDDLDKD